MRTNDRCETGLAEPSFSSMLALALTAVSAAADDDLPPLTLLDYDLLISGHDYSAEVAAAYSKDGLGILAVVGAPNSTIESPRRRLLQLAHTLATSPSEKLAAYERPELSYASGWSLGRETFKGKPDMSKGSWYAHALEDDPGAGDPSAHRYPLLTPTNIWPSALVGDDFEAAFKELSRGLYDLSAHVLRNADAYVEATNPSAPKGALLRSTHERSRLHVGRLLHYYAPNASDDAPAGGAGGAAEESDEDSGWCGWHNDNSVITCLPPALWLDEQTGEPIAAEECPAGGLVVRTRKGRRVGVQVPRGAILFQLGEAAQIISGGLLMATPHAVRKGGAQRAPPPTRTTRPLSPRPPRPTPTPTPTHLTTPHHPAPPTLRTAAAGISRESFALFVEPHWDYPIGDAADLAALHEGDRANDDVIPPLARRLKALPVEFGKFLVDSISEYYNHDQKGAAAA